MTDHQMQQGVPQKNPKEKQSPSAPFSIVVNNNSQDVKKARVARDINAAKHPIIIIAEKQAKLYGSNAVRLHQTFLNCAIIFENAEAEKNCYQAASDSLNDNGQPIDMAYYIHHQTIGLLDTNADGDGKHASVFTESDHIIVLGDLYGFHEDGFKDLQNNGQKVTFSNNMDTPVDLDKIAALQSDNRPFRDFAFRYRIGMPK